RLILKDGVWKEDFLPWSELMKLRAKYNDPTLPLELLLQNLDTVRQILDQTAHEVAAHSYLSAADAFGVLNARLHGQALARAPLVIAYMINLSPADPAPPKGAPVPIIELRGPAAELGESHGAQLGEGIRALYHEYFDRAFNFASADGRRLYERV